MSQAGANNTSGGGGGSGITTINGDSGSVTGAAVSFNASNIAGASVSFSGTGSLMSLNTSDSQLNTLIGKGTGGSTGTLNTALGTGSMITATGNENVAIGASSLETVSGTLNVALGAFSLRSLTTGSSNVSIGDSSGINLTSGHNNTIISGGNNYTGAESNNIVIENAGVVGESGIMRLGTTGTIINTFVAGIAGVTVANQEFVTIDSSTGQLGSSPIAASPARFQVYLTAPQSVAGGSTTDIIIFNSAVTNVGAAYNTATGVFTAPATGYYAFSCIIFFNSLNGLTANTHIIIGYTGSVQSLRLSFLEHAAQVLGNAIVVNGSWSMPMTAGETVSIQPFADGTGSYEIYGQALSATAFATSSTFAGYRLA